MNSKGYEAFCGAAAGEFLAKSPHFGKAYRDVYEWNWKQLHINYGDNVEFEKLAGQIVLCPETEAMIYAAPSPVRYIPGTRPQLENTVAGLLIDCKTEREKLLALLRFTRDLYKKYGGEQLFYGGTEEELIKKGEWLCECLGRLIVALAEIARIPGRIVMHVAGGHITAELYIEDGWVYVDPRCGMLYEKPNGRLASVRDCTRERTLFSSQPSWVQALVSDAWTYEFRNIQRNANVLLHPRELQTFCDYSLADAEKYHFDWLSVSAVHEALTPYAGLYDSLRRQIIP